MNLALDALPNFKAMPGPGAHLRGAISISPSVEYMERAYDDAKYGNFSRRPYIDMVIPTLTDPSVAPPGKHIMSCFVQYAPYKLRPGLNWDDQKEAFGDNVINTIAEYAPNIKDIILHARWSRRSIWNASSGLSEGNIFQGELSLEQLFFLRPVPGWAQFRTPIKNLYMCGSATHPGGGIMGGPGTTGGARNSERLQGGGLRCPKQRTRCRHHRWRPQRAGHRFLSGQSRIQAAGAGAPRLSPVARPSPKNFIPAFAAPPSRTPPGRCGPTSSATCNWRSTA